LALNNDPGKVTQLIQKKILDDLDDLIEQARKQSAQASSKPGPGKPGDAKPKPGEGQGKPQNANGQGKKPGSQTGGTSPAQDSSLTAGGDPNVDPSKDIHTKMTEWGGLTQREREAVLESKGETVIEKYRNYLDDYYKSLATKSTERQ